MHPSFIEIVVRKGGEISTLLSIRKKPQTFGKNVRHKRATSRTPVLHTVTQKKYMKIHFGILTLVKDSPRKRPHNDAKCKSDEFNQKSQTNDGSLEEIWNPAKPKEKKRKKQELAPR